MCGIAGAWGRPDQVGLVEAIVESQWHRGPDFQAVERISPTLVLGHNRLSIIDLSAAANQPLWDTSGRYALVFNGEIYNYLELRAALQAYGVVFRTNSDSEVLLEAFKAWGTEAVQRFNGMFAFALYDGGTETLYLVRDRFGVKPLYYRMDGHSLVFASTPQAIARHLHLAPDPAYLARGLRYWVYEADDDRSPYQGVHALRPGTILRATMDDAERIHLQQARYYDLMARVPERIDELAGVAEPALLEGVDASLTEAISLRLRADVPVGVSLSGGLDSSTVAARIARLQPNVTGFTFGHPEDAVSEGPQVALLAAQAGINVVYVRPDTNTMVEAFWETLKRQGAPFPSGSLVAQYLVFQAVRQAGVKVLLGGQGGDESFMGYHKYQLLRLKGHLLRREPGAALRAAFEVSQLAIAELGSLGPYVRALTRYGSRISRAAALRLPESEPLALGGGAERPGWMRQAEDITRFSLPTLLRYEDRNSMGNSVESRLPFLDFRLVELALALPEALKLRHGYGKWVLRELGAGLVPDAIRLARFKRGFDVPLHAWLAAGLGDALRTRMHDHAPDLRPWMQPGVDINDSFSDAMLIRRPGAFAEAVTLAWLAAQA